MTSMRTGEAALAESAHGIAVGHGAFGLPAATPLRRSSSAGPPRSIAERGDFG